MLTRHNVTIIVPLGIMLLLLIPAVAIPHQGARRLLFAAVLVAAVIVIIAYIVISELRQARLENRLDEGMAEQGRGLDDLAEQHAKLRRLVFQHLAVCTAHRIDRELDVDDLINQLLDEAKSREC